MDPREADDLGAAGTAPSTSDLFARLSRLQQDAGTTSTPSEEQAIPQGQSGFPAWFTAEQAAEQSAPEPQGAPEETFDVDSWQPAASGLSWQEEPASSPATASASQDGSSWAQTLVADAKPVAAAAAAASGEADNQAAANPTGLHDDIEKAGRKRRKSRVITILVILLALLAVGGGVGYYLYQGVNDGVEKLERSLELIGSTDEVVIAIDKAVNEDVNAETVGTLTGLIENASSLQSTLDEAASYAQDAIDARWVGNDKRVDVAKRALQDVEARKQILDLGSQIIDADYDAYRASDYLNQAWPLVVSADSRARNSAAVASAATTETMDEELPAAIEEARTAINELQTARELIEQAQAAMPDADFSSILAYIDAKISAVELSIDADQAMLDGSESEHSAALDAFVEADAVAVSAAAAMPPDPSTIITDAYTALTTDTLSAYYKARFSLVEADGYIREYLGVEDLAVAEVASQAN